MSATPFTATPYTHAGIALLVTGERDEDGCEITRITAADSAIDLFDLFRPSEVERMAERLDAQLSREAQAERGETQIDRYVAQREADRYARIESRVYGDMLNQLPDLTVRP